MLKVVQDLEASNEHTFSPPLLDGIVRNGAPQMLATPLQAKVVALFEAFADEVEEHGRRLVVRSGYHAEREMVATAGAVPVRQPRVNDKPIDPATGERYVCGGAAGSSTVTQSPPAARGVRLRVPSWACAMLLAIARPSPTPA